MRVSVVFRNTPVLVPVGEGRMKISELIEMAITRYKKTDSRLAEYTITVRSLRLLDGGSFVDLDDEVADVLDDKETVLADFDLIGDSLSTSSQESNSILPSSSSVTLASRVNRAHSSQPVGVSNLLTVPSSSNPSLADHDGSISGDMPPWTPSTSASVVTENDIHDVMWRQEHRTVSNAASHSNRSGSFASSQSGRFTPNESSLAREMAVDGPLQSNRGSFAESLSDSRLRLTLSDARSRNSYAGPGIYERERLYDDHYPPRRSRNKPYHLMDSSDYMRSRYRSHRLEGSHRVDQRFQERPPHGMLPRHGSASNILQQGGRLGGAAEDGSSGYQSRYDEPVDYFLSQPPYFHEPRSTNEPSGYALSQPAHTFRNVRSSVVHAADLDPNSEAPHLRHLSQDDHSDRSDTPTYRGSPVPEGMRLDAATYHGNRMLQFSDNDEDDYSDHGREELVGRQHQQQLTSRYVPFQRNKRFSIQRDGLVYARWAEYCENSGIPESDEDRDDESVRHITYSPNSSREEISHHGSSHHGSNHHGSSHRGGRTSSPLVKQEHVSEHSQAGNHGSHVQSATESESEDDLGNIHIIELHKGSHGLGIKIKKCCADNKDLGIFVDTMETEGFAAVSQKLQINDRILACNGCDFTKLPNDKAENMFKDMMDEPLLRMAISRGNQYAASGEGSDVSDYHHGDGDSTIDGSDPGYTVSNTKEIGVIHDIRIMKGGQGLGFGVTTRDVITKTGGSQPIYIKNISKDGPAFKDGKLKLGDRLLKVNASSVEQMTQSEVVQLMRSLPPGPVTLQVSRQETRQSSDDTISVLEVPSSDYNNSETVSSNVGVGSGRQVMTFDITMHQSDTASLGVTVHGRTRQNSPSHSSKNADIGIYIKSIVPKGLAAMDGRVQPGDQVLCVNGQNLLGKSNSDAMVVLKKALAEIKPATNMIQLVISRKTTSVPLKSPVAPSAAVANGDQHIEVGIDIGNAVMATPNSQSSQSSAGVVRIESTESLSSRRRNESEPLSKYSQEKSSGSHDYHGHQHTEARSSIITASGKSPVKRSSSESRYDGRHHHQSEAMLSHNLSSSGSGLISPTGVTLSLPDNNPTGTNQCYRPVSHHRNHTADIFTSSTPIRREDRSSKHNVDYPSHSLPRPSKPRKRVVSPSPQLESSGSTNELEYFKRDAPGRISIKKGKQGPQRDFSQFNFRNSEPKIEGDDSSSVDMMRTGSAESILANRSPVQYKIPIGPHLGLAKSSSLESLQTILAAQRLTETSDELTLSTLLGVDATLRSSNIQAIITDLTTQQATLEGVANWMQAWHSETCLRVGAFGRSREARSSFRKAVDRTYDKQDNVSDEVDNSLLDPSLISFTKNPKNKAKRRGFLKNLFRKGKAKRFASLGDHHGEITESASNQIDFDPTPPARVELRPHNHSNNSSGSSNKLYQRYSMSVLDNMEFEDDDITATIADV